AARAEQRYALVIGANPGWSQDRPLRYAENDAERIRDVLVSLGGFAGDRVELLRDPDTADVRASLRRLARAGDGAADTTLVFVYYSGHADARFLHLRGAPLSHQELQDTVRDLASTVKLAVIDACKSGAVTHKGGSPAEPFTVDVVSPRVSGLVILTSSGADELSQESRALAGSVFTHHLVSGLRGAADRDSDRQVTVAEAYQYAYERTRADTAPTTAPQRPGFRYELTGQGELVLTRLATPRDAQLVVPRGPARRYVVLDASEWRLIAEARSEPDREVALSLAPGDYHVKRVADDRLEVASVTLAAGKRTELGRAGYRSASLSTGILKGDPGDLAPAERHEWMRARAFGVLAEGQSGAALDLFDQLLREAPGDPLALRGRGRALIRMAEAYQQVHDQVRERRALGDALRDDPSLASDPEFQRWYERLGELDGRAHVAAAAQRKLEQDAAQNPRTVLRAGVSVDLLSARGLFAVSGTAVLHRFVTANLGFDFSVLGFDANLLLAPISSRWSPYFALGGHVALRKLGVGVGPSNVKLSSNMLSYTGDDLWGLHGRFEVGGQFVGRSGFTTDLGLAIITFRKPDGEVIQQAWPVFHFGWLW
ncbi:MAG TPA: caspase family protein, partial [Kofleriaceae bacterium]|nr:caspase family protein [Kofleriaceae bacterium]